MTRGHRRRRAAGLAAALAALAGAAPAGAGDVGRYQFGCRSDQGTFVLDTQTGRVWRFDREDDAWYLYDLEALVPRTSGRPAEAPPAGAGEEEKPPAR